MLELPEIKSNDFEDTLDGLVRQIPTLTDKWTNFGESGVGMTLLELLTYVSLLQRENMNKISGDALYNLGRLFGFEPKKAVPACGFASISGGASPLTKLYSSDNVFETLESAYPCESRAVLFGRNKGAKIEPYGTSDGELKLRLFADSDTFVAGFSAPFETGKKNTVFFRFDTAGRIYPDNMDSFKTGFETAWQYYGTEAGTDGWHELDVDRDETYFCFKSGLLSFSLRGKHAKLGNVYPLRCIVKKRGFDILPVLTGVFTSVCRIAAQDTKCVRFGFDIDEFGKNAMYFDCALANSRVFTLMINTKNGYAKSDELDVEYEIVSSPDGQRLVRLVTSSRAELSELFSELTDEEKKRVFLLVIYEKPYIKEFCSCTADGSANQRIPLSFGGVIPERTEILVSEQKDGRTYYKLWRYTSDLSECGARDKAFFCDGGGIIFGDGRHGAVPCERFAEILITSLCLTDGENYPAGKLHRENSGGTAERITEISGGSAPESPDEFFTRAISEKKPHTLITAEDFEERAANTEGLLIKRAEAFATPLGKGIKPNSVTVTIEPCFDGERENRSKLSWYIDNVYANLRDYCPAAMELIVRFPEYVPIDVRVSMCGGNLFSDVKRLIQTAIEDELSQKGIFRADYVAIFRKLNDLTGAGKITALVLSSESLNARICGDGSVEFPAHSRPFLKNLTLILEA